jgi:cytochrome c
MKDRTNTIAGWVLAGAIAALGLSIVTGEHFHGERPEKMGYTVEGVEAEGGDTAEAAEKPIAFYLQTADPAKGADVFKKCAACHNAEKGGPNQIGPNLWGVPGEPIGQGAAGFAFSDALKAKGGTWDFDKLNEWLKSPKKFADGTKMTFAGLSKPEDRANVIAYLDKQTDHPIPFPPAPTEAAATAAGTNADAKPGANTKGEGAAKQPVVTEQQAAANPKGTVSGEGAPSVAGTAKQTTK